MIDFNTDVEEVENQEDDDDFGAVVRESWDSTPENPKWVIVNETMYEIPNNTYRWKLLYRIKFKLPDDFDIGFYTRYTVRARFYGNTQALASYTPPAGAFQPNTLIEGPAGYGESGLLHGVTSPSDDGWGQVSWLGEPCWDGQGASPETMLQRYNLDRKGGTINDVWAPLRFNDLPYPPYILIQTSDAYIGHIEVTEIVFHNGEKEYTVYEDEDDEEPEDKI